MRKPLFYEQNQKVKNVKEFKKHLKTLNKSEIKKIKDMFINEYLYCESSINKAYPYFLNSLLDKNKEYLSIYGLWVKEKQKETCELLSKEYKRLFNENIKETIKRKENSDR